MYFSTVETALGINNLGAIVNLIRQADDTLSIISGQAKLYPFPLKPKFWQQVVAGGGGNWARVGLPDPLNLDDLVAAQNTRYAYLQPGAQAHFALV